MNTDKYKNTEFGGSAPNAKTRIALMLIPSFIMFLTGLLMILCAAFLSGRQEALPAGTTDVSITELHSESQSNGIFAEECEYYVIREDDDGYIAVYLSGGQLYKRLDIRTFTLPDSDRERLEIGIPVQSDAELAMYIEGFSG